MHLLCPASLALAFVAPISAAAAPSTDTPPPADIKAIRQEIDAMRAAYEARLQALEERLKAAESAAVAPPAPAVAATTAPPSSPAAAVKPGANPGGSGANAFNPAISLILSGQYARISQDPADYAITGFQLPADAELGPGERGFGLGETELRMSASIDSWLRGDVTLAVAEEGVEVEEAFIETTALDHGLTLRAGRFFSGIGYLNSQHAHSWDFADNPLAYQALLGNQHGNDGLRLSWLAPTDQYIELSAEVGRGDGFPGGGNEGHGAGTWALAAHTGGDVGDSHSWRGGVSMLNAKAWDQELAAIDATGTAVTNTFTGNSRVWVADAVWKWAPNGNATRTNFKLQGEYLRSTRRGNLVYDLDGANSEGAYRATQSGWYLQGIYQFMPRWRVGLRTEQLDAGSPDYGSNAGFFAANGYQPRKNTLMLDFSPSEFSRLRLQFGQDRSRDGVTDNQVFLQYQMSLGAHGAHGF